MLNVLHHACYSDHKGFLHRPPNAMKSGIYLVFLFNLSIAEMRFQHVLSDPMVSTQLSRYLICASVCFIGACGVFTPLLRVFIFYLYILNFSDL